MSSATVRFSMEVRIVDAKAFVAAAVAKAIEDGVDEADAKATYAVSNLGACAQMLFDPGVSPAGCEIEDSGAELIHWEPESAVDGGNAHRRDWQLDVCLIAGIELIQSEDEESVGRWDWRSRSGEGCDASFDTKADAAAGAVESLFPRADWQREVAEGDTGRGYEEWALNAAEHLEDGLTSSASP